MVLGNDRWTEGVPIPDSAPEKVYDVVYPQLGQPLDVTILAMACQGYMVHWIGPCEEFPRGCTRVCGVNDNCLWCGVASNTNWTGYVASLDNSRNRRVVLCVSAGAGRQIQTLAQGLSSVRGMRLLVQRSKRGSTTPVRVAVSEMPAKNPVPEPHDIGPTLSRLWGNWVRGNVNKTTTEEGEC